MKTLFQLKSYVRFLRKATNQHGVHSPFVFRMVTKCFYDGKEKTEYASLKEKRKSIAPPLSIITDKEAKLLFRIVRYFQPGSILEIDNSSELLPFVVQSGHPEAKYFLTSSDSEKNLPNTLDLVYFNFTAASLVPVFEELLLKIHNDSFFIFEGIHKTHAMEQFWNTIKMHQKITVTIDIYNFGLVFFRKEQAKEHFTIRV